ncbi:winged helix-turn-helix domain-containing protein [Streptomyces sp. NPDC087297]|uniref:winged helix-turn-helix domain-containing protein n=1 Tax=Streptomyces sp. NPDC087297 TaxID=3365778 RepID=UPI0038005901
MTTAVPAPAVHRPPAPRLQLVGDRPPGVLATHGGRVGYLVYLAADVDPVALMEAHGIRPENRSLGLRTPPALPALPALQDPEPEPASHPDPAPLDDAVRVDRARRLVEVDGSELELTYLEFELLAHLVSHPGTVHTRDSLISAIWGYGNIGDGRTVDVHVARLRRKLGPGHRGRISTVRSVGYKYVPGHHV